MASSAQGYLIGNFTVTDPELMTQYSQQAGPLAQAYGGEVMVAASGFATVEGQAQSTLIVIRFPSLAKAEAFYHDPAYAPVKALRVKATTGGFLTLVPGPPVKF
ncbi:DUF1330 domain-containing protein [Asaia sp. As-1742]|uniref:DUF1330 domain-containing protein n=1 Tax=Asaia sp. As-1742 TaxID=2608325 RepID=UPI0014225B91|nr:DUF1330 domain-containing protein [Asaia sp. As-1742]NIE81734.1 DUF1330 domain-containing protein [Asaia sp. As-1742]